MSAPSYESRVRVVRDGVNRRAFLPARDEPVSFGHHSEVAEHYGVVDPEGKETNPTTLDYIVAAAAG